MSRLVGFFGIKMFFQLLFRCTIVPFLLFLFTHIPRLLEKEQTFTSMLMANFLLFNWAKSSFSNS